MSLIVKRANMEDYQKKRQAHLIEKIENYHTLLKQSESNRDLAENPQARELYNKEIGQIRGFIDIYERELLRLVNPPKASDDHHGHGHDKHQDYQETHTGDHDTKTHQEDHEQPVKRSAHKQPPEPSLTEEIESLRAEVAALRHEISAIKQHLAIKPKEQTDHTPPLNIEISGKIYPTTDTKH